MASAWMCRRAVFHQQWANNLMIACGCRNGKMDDVQSALHDEMAGSDETDSQ
jgi:hypothetical protein